MISEALGWLIVLSPVFLVLVCAITVFGKNDTLSGYAEKSSDWFAAKDSALAQSQAFWSKYVLRWVLWPFKKIGDLAAGIADRHWRSGVRILGYGCFTFILLFVAAVAAYMAIVIAVAAFVIVVAFKVFVGESDSRPTSTSSARSYSSYRDDSPDVQSDDDAVGSPGVRGQKIYSGTNWFNEELKGRVDEEGNLYKGTNWFNEEKIGRIDDEGNVYSGTNWANEEKVGRIDQDGTLYKGSNWFTEEKTGRIDEDGTIHKGTNWLNEEKSGRTGD